MGRREKASGTGRRRPGGVPVNRGGAWAWSARLGTPFGGSFTLPSPMLEKQGPGRCGKGEEVNPSCHCTRRGWKEHMFYGERPRPPLPQLLKPDTTSRPRGPSPAPHQVVVLLIIAHEIILHVRHLGREGEGGRRNRRQPPPTILRGSEASRPASPRLPVALRRGLFPPRNKCASLGEDSLGL